MKKIFSLTALLISCITFSAQATEKAYEGIAKPWQLGMQEPASPIMERLVFMHDGVFVAMCIAISVFVLALMLYICFRFNRKRNPVPSKKSHNTTLEIIWTTIPILILIAIAIPSLRLHYDMERDTDSEMTLKVVGYQWYWHYEYPDQGGINFDSYMLKDAELKEGDHRLLAVDNRVVVPVDTKIRVKITGADVIHAFAVPAFGIKRDAIPGRLNETYFKATKIGTFYGQCSELCGVGHAFMPIVIDVVSKDDFNKWTAMKKKEAGIIDNPVEKPDAKTDVKSDKKSNNEAVSNNKHITKSK
ncbi:MAG: cytochrome c oxidase subunit II [Rickettsiales bacterium]